jgi:multiple sugar transport system substrate-binding protein
MELLKTGKVKDESGKMQEIKITEKDIQVLNTFISSAVYRGKSDSRKIGDILFEESPAYFTGQKSAEAVGKLIQNKVMLYLNE